jgi:hypothetical protein
MSKQYRRPEEEKGKEYTYAQCHRKGEAEGRTLLVFLQSVTFCSKDWIWCDGKVSHGEPCKQVVCLSFGVAGWVVMAVLSIDQSFMVYFLPLFLN